MNKDVVYIEPEEDITDIIAKIKGAKSKIVALVPPKKAGVFKSIVNIKLIMKSGASAEKTVVLVTTDPAIIKLAAATRMPVTRDLQSAPSIPEMDEAIDETETVSVDDEAEDAEETSDDEPEKSEDSKEDDSDNSDEDSDDEADSDEDETEVEEDEKPAKSTKNAEKKTGKSSEKAIKGDLELEEAEEPSDTANDKKGREKAEKKPKGKLASSNNKILRWIGTHKKADAAIGVGAVVLILVLVWMFAIAPAVTITLKLETVKGNFSENIAFTEKLSDEKVSEGKFYIEEKKMESKTEVEFEATGSKNVGEKASGKIKVTHYFPLDEDGGTVAVGNGATFTNSGLTYTVTSGATIKWDGDVTAAEGDCENYSKTSGWSNRNRGCAVSATVTVTANDSGSRYNISGTSSGWSSSVGGLDVISNEAFSGGSDKTVTVVQQSDIDAALAKITTENESTNKSKLLDSLSDDQFAIESSFKQTVGDPVSTPKVGEEVESGKKAKLSVTTTDTIFVLDETKLKEYITDKAKLDKGYKIYEMNDPFVENFTKTDSGYVGKLKTSYTAGSTITENEVVETAKGKGIGSAKRDISDNFSGIKSIAIDTSVPWVTSVPGNTEKITVNISVEE